MGEHDNSQRELWLLSTPSLWSRPMPSIEHLSFCLPSSEMTRTPFDTNSSPFPEPSSPQLVSSARQMSSHSGQVQGG
ncbi:hypothetical protein K443DRAFT_679077 [Laccaria amethystina LaAM-08-1]|uniref:Uncharacterized protein n=1 Tax=Laccaria amethystina LaAM-08-1 TaxID=1095629 RepID=A0A0C9X6E7_9AGAR|nr:hypothetical protein K443DRAFT_679077 [Laccaria amethystina LaAM-08-1]